jgi:membrane-associated phospholipid phosphatase
VPGAAQALPAIVAIGRCGTGFSFPSSHSVIAGAAAVGLLLVTRGLVAWLGVLAALLIVFSRVYLGVHYPHGRFKIDKSGEPTFVARS